MSGLNLVSFDGMLLKLLADTTAFQRLTHINLANNKMTAFINQEMPSELYLPNIKGLNLLDNLQLPVQETILQVLKMFPNLETLEMSLSEENDVSFILAKMPRLLQLNGIAVESELVEESQKDYESQTAFVDLTYSLTNTARHMSHVGKSNVLESKQMRLIDSLQKPIYSPPSNLKENERITSLSSAMHTSPSKHPDQENQQIQIDSSKKLQRIIEASASKKQDDNERTHDFQFKL